MASAGGEGLKVEPGDERSSATDEEVERKRSDSTIKRLRRKISQGLRLSFIKDDEDSVFSPDQQNTNNGQSQNGTSLSIRSSLSSSSIGKLPVKPVVRRVASDSVGGRLRKISFENGRRYSAEYSPEDFAPQPLSPYGQLDQYEKLEQLGEGSYATVFKGIYSANGQVVALKEIRLQEEEGAPFTAIREASLLKQLNHSNIVRLYDIIHTKDVLMFVFEFVDTDLNAYLERYPRGIPPHNVKLFLFQLLRGLAYIHKRKILHRDIKPQNLLINENGELKLADFGLARAKSVPSHTYSHEVVTLWYRPPDVLLGSNDYTTSLDMWGVGCIFVEMITGLALFPGMSDTIDQLNKIWQVLGTPTEETWPGLSNFPEYNSDLFYNFLPQRLGCAAPKLLLIRGSEALASRMIQFIPKNRISAPDAMSDPYFSGLPPEVFSLSPSESIFSVPGVEITAESN